MNHRIFAEPSAFHRAFKKWTGANPGEYRQGGQPGAKPLSSRKQRGAGWPAVS